MPLTGSGQTEQFILSIINPIDIASPTGDCEGTISILLIRLIFF